MKVLSHVNFWVIVNHSAILLCNVFNLISFMFDSQSCIWISWFFKWTFYYWLYKVQAIHTDEVNKVLHLSASLLTKKEKPNKKKDSIFTIESRFQSWLVPQMCFNSSAYQIGFVRCELCQKTTIPIKNIIL